MASETASPARKHVKLEHRPTKQADQNAAATKPCDLSAQLNTTVNEHEDATGANAHTQRDPPRLNKYVPVRIPRTSGVEQAPGDLPKASRKVQYAPPATVANRRGGNTVEFVNHSHATYSAAGVAKECKTDEATPNGTVFSAPQPPSQLGGGGTGGGGSVGQSEPSSNPDRPAERTRVQQGPPLSSADPPTPHTAAPHRTAYRQPSPERALAPPSAHTCVRSANSTRVRELGTKERGTGVLHVSAMQSHQG